MSAFTEAQQAQQAAAAAHLELLETLDIHSASKPFRNPSWKPNHRRNKNIKTVLLDAAKREAASVVASAVDSPADESGAPSTSGASTPGPADGHAAPNLAQASRSLSKLVLEKTLRSNGGGVSSTPPSITYVNIESAPTLTHAKRYCDVTGLHAPYRDRTTNLTFHNSEVFEFIRNLIQGTAEQYLEARGAQTVLK